MVIANRVAEHSSTKLCLLCSRDLDFIPLERPRQPHLPRKFLEICWLVTLSAKCNKRRVQSVTFGPPAQPSTAYKRRVWQLLVRCLRVVKHLYPALQVTTLPYLNHACSTRCLRCRFEYYDCELAKKYVSHIQPLMLQIGCIAEIKS
jgi:hypothetical protein